MGTVASREGSSGHTYPSNIKVTEEAVASPKWLVNGKIVLRLVQIGSLVTYLHLVGRSADFGYKTGGLTATPVLYAIRELLDNFTLLTDAALYIIGLRYGRIASRPILRLLGDDVPRVDLLICCKGEDLGVIKDTVLAACDLDYPREKLRIVVADDSTKPQEISTLMAVIENINDKFKNVIYVNRPKLPNHHNNWKAGNINGVTEILKQTPEKLAEYMCIMDSDMIADPDMLRALLAHTVGPANEKVALVTLPQDFYNIPNNDVIHQNMILQHRQDQGDRDRLGNAWCPGTGFIFRTEMAEEIGGFPTGAICEDVIFGWKLNGAGYDTIQVNELLQCGQQPSTLHKHLTQRRKWFAGHIRNCVPLQYGMHPDLKDLTLLQRLAIINQLPKAFFSTMLRCVAFMIMAICLFRGDRIIAISAPKDLYIVLLAWAVLAFTTEIQGYLDSMTYGRANWRRREMCKAWTGVHLTKACLQEILPDWLGGKKLGFAITGEKDVTEMQERNATLRPGVFHRIWTLCFTEYIFVHPMIFTVLATLWLRNIMDKVATSEVVFNETYNVDYLVVLLLNGPLFPGLRLNNVLSFLVPVYYMINPPNMPPRHELMYVDPRTGGHRPKPEYRGVNFSKHWILTEIPFAIIAWGGILAAWVYQQAVLH